MKQMILTVLLLAVAHAQAQIHNPASWSATLETQGENTYTLVVTAKIEGDWHLYSQYTPEGGPTATAFSFEGDPAIEWIGRVQEQGELHQRFEEVFGVETRFYEGEVSFVQALNMADGFRPQISGTVRYMLCNDEMCLPPTQKEFGAGLQ